ncbi:MAG: ABC transporter permease, partial [Proteobacteria bacterium]|nr:ABC transporter permease [Pseudomonadota bacterium]
PPYQTYIPYPIYIIPGLIGMILLFNGMQTSLSMVYDREMGVMKILMTAPVPRWYLLFGKMLAGTTVSVVQVYLFLVICTLFDYSIPWWGWLRMLPAIFLVGFMLSAFGLFLSSCIPQLENFAGVMNFVIFPAFFLSSALYPLWRVLEGSELVYNIAMANPFTHSVEFIRFAIYGKFELTGCLVVVGVFILFWILGVRGYSPQKGMSKRAIAH